MINWILQKNLTKPDVLNRIKSALNGVDEIWEEVEVIPFSEEKMLIKNRADLNVIYGSTTLMLSAFNNQDLRAGLFYDPSKFNMEHYVNKWGDRVLNADGKQITFGAINEIKSPPEKEWFIRPNHDSKTFSGRVDSYEKILAWSQKICQLNLPDFNQKTEVWIAEPKQIDKEWRLFIVDNCILSASRYLNQGKLDESNDDLPQEMLDLAHQLINSYRLADVYVIDIALLNSVYKLIECNCFNATGFYQHNIEKIIKAINQFIKENRRLVNQPKD